MAKSLSKCQVREQWLVLFKRHWNWNKISWLLTLFLIKNNNHTQFFVGHELPSHYVPSLDGFPGIHQFQCRRPRLLISDDFDKLVFWNNVKLQEIVTRHNRRRFQGLIVRNVVAILCKESLSTIPSVERGTGATYCRRRRCVQQGTI